MILNGISRTFIISLYKIETLFPRNISERGVERERERGWREGREKARLNKLAASDVKIYRLCIFAVGLMQRDLVYTDVLYASGRFSKATRRRERIVRSFSKYL